MSDMERIKVTLQKVLDGHGTPVNIQNWLESEWSVYMDCEVHQTSAYQVLNDFFKEQDWSFSYYLFDDQLWMVVDSKEIDVHGHIEAEFSKDDMSEIKVDAMFYNGGGDLSECITSGLKKLENEL